jgi:tryptophan synthase alpha chain
MGGEGRISAVLTRLTDEGKKALVPFFSVGDPDLATTRECVLAAIEAGADMVELGVPFSDPIADGPVIQASSQRALANGASLPAALELTAGLRAVTQVPIVLFGYYNPFFRYGDEALARDAVRAGADGVLCVDLPPEEAAPLVSACRACGLDRVFLLAPTSDDARIEAVSRVASGFVYFVAVTGVTGGRSAPPTGIETKVERVRELCDLPVGVGFGISSAEQAAAVAKYADLVIVGSALVARMHEAGSRGAASATAGFVGELRTALDRG